MRKQQVLRLIRQSRYHKWRKPEEWDWYNEDRPEDPCQYCHLKVGEECQATEENPCPEGDD